MNSAPTSSHIRILILEDHPAICDALEQVIADEMDMTVVDCAPSGDNVHALIEREKANVLIVDLSLAGEDGLEVLANIQDDYPDLPALVYSMHDEQIYAERALQAGARGYLMKTAPIQDVVKAIRQIFRGRIYLSGDMQARCIEHLATNDNTDLSVGSLSKTERIVFESLGRGNSLSAVADNLDISRKTVEHHRRQAKEKLGLDSVGQLLQHAIAWVQSRPKNADASDDSSWDNTCSRKDVANA